MVRELRGHRHVGGGVLRIERHLGLWHELLLAGAEIEGVHASAACG